MEGLIAATELSFSSDFLGFAVIAFGAITGGMAYYIKTTVKNATITLNQLNGGSHLADLPEKVKQMDIKLDRAAEAAAEAKVTARVVLKNQIKLMSLLLPANKHDLIDRNDDDD